VSQEDKDNQIMSVNHPAICNHSEYPFFNMEGIVISNPDRKGIYIQGGKKYLMK